jgi:hypothetical protein
MISWIVASHDEQMLQSNLIPTLPMLGTDQLIVLRGYESITKAYADGQKQATNLVRCYIHHDVQILNLQMLRIEILSAALMQRTGMVGVIGSKDMIVPWWNGRGVGSVMDSRLGRISFSLGGECAVLDGLLLATAKDVDWDLDWPGWHGYDYDSCKQMLQRGLTNRCISHGDDLVFHNSDSPVSLHAIDGWQSAATFYTEKWDS